MNKAVIAVIVIVLFTVGGFLFGKYTAPEKIVIKKEYIQQNTEKEQDRVIIRQIVRPDGTTETVTTKEKIKETTNITTEKQQSEVSNKKPQWKVSALATTEKFKGFSYGAMVERRILGPFSAGIVATTGENKQLGVVIGFEF